VTDLESVAEQAAKEWDYTESESQFDRDPLPVSIPCQLRFTEPPERDVERFHDALADRGYTPVASNPTHGYASPHYDGAVCSTDHYNRVRVVVFRSNVVRLYPKDEYVPTAAELTALLGALAAGFDAPLDHDPVEEVTDP
jgi:hypothetical protein